MPDGVDKVGYPEKSHGQLHNLTWFQKAFCLLWKLPTLVHLKVNKTDLGQNKRCQNQHTFNNIRRIKNTPDSSVYWKTHDNTGSLSWMKDTTQTIFNYIMQFCSLLSQLRWWSMKLRWICLANDDSSKMHISVKICFSCRTFRMENPFVQYKQTLKNGKDWNFR